MKQKTLIILLLVFSLSCAYSQEQESTLNDTIDIDEVIITGTTVKVSRFNVPLSVTVVSNRQIAENSESNILPVLNGRVPGLFITERGVMGFGVSTGAAGQISLRGIGSSPTTGVLMLIDGHPQFMGIFGHPLPDSYTASDVEKVEVIRGPASLLYGSNAMGGVINIITREQKEEGINATGRIMFGSYNTQKYMASAGYKHNKFSVFASVNHDQTDGHRANSDFNITNGYTKLAYNLNSHLDLSTDLSLAHFKASDPGPDTLDASAGNTLDIKRGYWAMTLNNNYERFSGTTKLFYNFGEHKISDGFHSNDINYGINIYESIRLFKGNNLTLGADYLTYGGVAENEIYSSSIIDTTIYDAGIYGFMQQTLFDRLTINAGLRLQNHEVYGTEWIPACGFAWKIGENTTWKTSIAKGFRSPTIRELFIWNHNASLLPEKVMNYETGVLHSFMNNNLTVEITAFILKGRNMIITVPSEGLQNAGDVSNKGLELAVTARLIRDLNLIMNYSYINMKEPVYATPRHNLFTSADYKFKKLRFMISAQYINRLDSDPAIGSEAFETYTLLNSKVSWKPLKFAEVFLSFENLLNQRYATNIYYTMPGITASGGIKVMI